MDKCATLAIVRGQETVTGKIELSEGQIIEALESEKIYTYLGMAQRADCLDELIKSTVRKEFIRRSKPVWKSMLSAKNKVKAFNSICVGLLSYSFGISKWTQNELQDVEEKVRKIMTMNKGFNKHSDVDRIFLQIKFEGRGLICIRDFHGRMCISTVGYIMTAKKVQGKQLKTI